MTTEPTLAEIIREAIDSRLLDLHVAMPAKVVSYDDNTQTIEAQPQVRRAVLDVNGKVRHEELPNIPNVPVLFPSSSNFSASWPLAKGDYVLLIFNSSAIGNWRESGDLSEPGDLRRHDLSYAAALPGIRPKSETIPTANDAVVLEVGGSTTHIAVGASASEFVARADKVLSELQSVATALTTHTHSGVTTGVGNTGPSNSSYSASAVEATKLKTE